MSTSAGAFPPRFIRGNEEVSCDRIGGNSIYVTDVIAFRWEFHTYLSERCRHQGNGKTPQPFVSCLTSFLQPELLISKYVNFVS
jgi:hypothetical protein